MQHGRQQCHPSARVRALVRRVGVALLASGTAALAGCDVPVLGLDPEIGPPEGPVQLVNFDVDGNPLLRFDVKGEQVDAHGGEIRRFGDLYYWYGETYGCGFEWRKHAPSPFCGFRVYTSGNLADWEDRGLLFDVSTSTPWQTRCNWWSYGCFRPHVLHNPRTGRYVLWVNVYDRPVSYYVLEATDPAGPFVERGVPRLAFNNDATPGRVNNGDHNLFVDDDGTGYIVYSEWAIEGGDLVVERLTPDFLSGTGEHVRLGVKHSESPSLFKRDGRYYITASYPPNAAYGASATAYFTAPAPLGPWSPPNRISRNSCGGQPFHVSQLPTSTGEPWYLYQSDLWINSDGKEAGDPNQAPAAMYWGPLRFDSRGGIAPITCRASYRVDALTSGAPNPDPPAFRLQCDIGSGVDGRSAREFRVQTRKAGRLRAVQVPVYQRGEPNAPLEVEVRSPRGSVLLQRAVERNAGPWHVPPNIAWAARKLRVEADARVDAGEVLTVRLRSSASRGCYGFAFRDRVARVDASSYRSDDGGRSWVEEAGREARVELEID